MHKKVADFLNARVSESKATHEERENGDDVVVVEPGSLHQCCQVLKEDAEMDFKVLQVVSGVDYPEENIIEVNYMLSNFFKNHEIILKVRLPRDNPKVESVCDLWKSANFQERETYDMLGVEFENHPDPRRILCPDDWEGWPLRKDYEAAKKYHAMEIYPEAKMNMREREFVDLQKAAEKEGRKVTRPELETKENLIGI